MDPSQPKTSSPSTRRILWLIGSLVIGYAVGNIVFALPFAAILYYGVPDTKWNERWTGWRKLPPPTRAIILTVLMYASIRIFLLIFGPWLTAGMGR